jgi:hypothetical protein
LLQEDNSNSQLVFDDGTVSCSILRKRFVFFSEHFDCFEKGKLVNKRKRLIGALVFAAIAAGCTLYLRHEGEEKAAPKKPRISVSVPEVESTDIAGPDQDKNGVRDDIDKWIREQLPESAEVKVAATKLAASFQKTLLEADDKEKSIQNIFEEFKRMDCLTFLYPETYEGGRQAYQVINAVKRFLVNSNARRDADVKADRHFGGQVSTALLRADGIMECAK